MTTHVIIKNTNDGSVEGVTVKVTARDVDAEGKEVGSTVVAVLGSGEQTEQYLTDMRSLVLTEQAKPPTGG